MYGYYMLRSLARLAPLARTAPRATAEAATIIARRGAARATLRPLSRQPALATSQASRRLGPTFFPPRPASVIDIPTAESIRRRCISTHTAVLDWPGLLSTSFITATSFCLTAAAWCYQQVTGQPLTNQVIVDRQGDRYLAMHADGNYIDPESGHVVKPYETIYRRLFGDQASEGESWQEDYYILFPVQTNAEGEFYIDYSKPVSASKVDTYNGSGTENLTYLVTAENYEGRGLGTFQLLRAAERCADNGRDFTGDPIDSAVSFYAHVLNQIGSVLGEGTRGQLFDLASYQTTDDPDAFHDISIPNRALKVLLRFAKIREALHTCPTARQETIDEHPDLKRLHSELKASLLNPQNVLSVHHGLEQLFGRIAEMEELTSRLADLTLHEPTRVMSLA